MLVSFPFVADTVVSDVITRTSAPTDADCVEPSAHLRLNAEDGRDRARDA
jgi:hypothetical protein